ncbi:DUF3263 domain-containing protein [Streptomyces sp. YIM 98790]|uniref:DUF3263 domain-containing protein n=1 Tax=Streptomyces sp. YIM 98790 TaxID=2689077 RepID=UPI00140841A1
MSSSSDEHEPEPEPGQEAAGRGEGDGEAGEAGGRPGLSERDRAVLELAGRNWSGRAAWDRAIREHLDMSPTRYHQLLNALLDDPRALAHAPVTVNRLRARRDERRAAR